MFKTRSIPDKETLSVLTLGLIFIVMVVMNIVALGPVLIKVYSVGKMPGNQSPIDVRTVNQAIDYLNP